MNRNVIWEKRLLFVAAPFLLCFGLLLFSILRSLYADKVEQAHMALSYQAQFNQSRLLGKVDSVYMSVMTAVNFLRALDASRPDARRSGEDALFVMLDNPDIHNAWLVYEPDAFDGRDRADKEGYPGAPSGRYMRSFVRGDNGPVAMGDMNESIVDDPLLAPWYATTKRTGRPYIAINDEAARDYRRNTGKVHAVSIVLPIFRGNVFVGCVGGDLPIDQIIDRGEERLPIVSILFSPDYRVRFAPDVRDVGKSLDETGLANVDAVKRVFQASESLFLDNEPFYFTGEKSFVYFSPLRFEEFKTTAYLALGMPTSVIDRSLYPIVMSVALALIVLLLLFLGLLFYVGRLISRPIQALAQVAGNASLDDACQFSLEQSEGEVGRITRAFLNMATALQARVKDERWPQEMLELHLTLEEGMYRGESLESLFRHTASRFSACFGALRVTLEQAGAGGAEDACEVASYTPSDGLSPERKPARWAPLWMRATGGRVIWREKTDAPNAKAHVCVLPIRVGGALWGGLTLVLAGPLAKTRAQHLECIAAGMEYLLARREAA
jgi:methyl-accepting chemotaxis protein